MYITICIHYYINLFVRKKCSSGPSLNLIPVTLYYVAKQVEKAVMKRLQTAVHLVTWWPPMSHQ